MVASYFTFGAVYGAFATEFTATTGGAVFAGATAGAAAGFASSALVTRSYQMALRGAAAGAISGGIAKYYGPNGQSWQRVAVETVAGGVEAQIQGGDFIDGVKSAFVLSTLNYANYRMRKLEVERSAQNDYNINGDSMGFYGDGKKLAGARRYFDPLIERLRKIPCDSNAGACQGTPVNAGDVRARLGPIAYSRGSILDYVTESFAGLDIPPKRSQCSEAWEASVPAHGKPRFRSMGSQ